MVTGACTTSYPDDVALTVRFATTGCLKAHTVARRQRRSADAALLTQSRALHTGPRVPKIES